jgi:hypothetical protein
VAFGVFITYVLFSKGSVYKRLQGENTSERYGMQVALFSRSPMGTPAHRMPLEVVTNAENDDEECCRPVVAGAV